jgi:hypothetical protein
MAWYRPMQRKDGKWDYTCTNSAGTFPLGYCHSYRQLTPDAGGHFDQATCARENESIAPFRHKYHDGGHKTGEQAEDCYREYELDQLLQFDAGENAKQQYRCGICDEWTTGSAMIAGGFRNWHLCANHQTREFVEKLWVKESEKTCQ